MARKNRIVEDIEVPPELPLPQAFEVVKFMGQLMEEIRDTIRATWGGMNKKKRMEIPDSAPLISALEALVTKTSDHLRFLIWSTLSQDDTLEKMISQLLSAQEYFFLFEKMVEVYGCGREDLLRVFQVFPINFDHVAEGQYGSEADVFRNQYPDYERLKALVLSLFYFLPLEMKKDVCRDFQKFHS